AAAAKGFRVVAFDPDPARAAAIEAGILPVVEPELDRLFREHHRTRLGVTADAAALTTCSVVYIASDVPTDDGGVSDLRGITELIDRVGPGLNETAALVVLCQVPPGFTRGLSAPPPARRYYQVETLVFGKAVERALHPERFIIGCADPDAPLPGAYRAILDAFACPVLPMRYESAELAKIAINCCLVASVSITNSLAELSERVGADWAEIAPALRLDRRIGAHAYLTPGLGLAGGNLERDLATVLRLAAEQGVEAGVVAAFVRNSQHRRDWALRMLHAELLDNKPDAVVGVLGLAYKEDTHSTKNSPALGLIEHLNPRPARPSRVVVLGAGGFVGSAIARRLATDGIASLPVTRKECDLLAPDAASRLGGLIRATDSVVLVSAIAPARAAADVTANVRMGEVVCQALGDVSPAHVVYVSSDAVYADDANPVTEQSCCHPSSLHGVMHLAREVMLSTSA